MMAKFPDRPDEEEQRALASYVWLFARLYPWYDFPTRFASCTLLSSSLDLSFRFEQLGMKGIEKGYG